MPAHIIQHNNVFNVYTTISDGCYFESGLTLEQLKEWYELEYGKRGMLDFDLRIGLCMAKGTSSLIDDSLEECVRSNRAGPRESRLKFKDFVEKYLTIAEPADIDGSLPD